MRTTLALMVFAVLWASAALAAGGASSELPGGAALGLWRCGGGLSTTITVENVRDYAVLVHVAFYDHCSEEVFNFTVPLMAADAWAGIVTCDGSEVRLEGRWSDFDGPNNGEEPRTRPSEATFGYFTVAITAVDDARPVRPSGAPACAGPGGVPGRLCGDGDPRNDYRWSGQRVLLPDALVVRTVITSAAGGSAASVPPVMLQGFVNLGGDDLTGVLVEENELALFNDAGAGCRAPVPGALNTTFWAPYTRGSSLITVFPGGGVGCANPVTLSLTILDDNMLTTSASLSVEEVSLSVLGVDLMAYDRGMVRLTLPANAPFFGYVVMEAPGDISAVSLAPEASGVLNGGTCVPMGIYNLAGTVY